MYTIELIEKDKLLSNMDNYKIGGENKYQYYYESNVIPSIGDQVDIGTYAKFIVTGKRFQTEGHNNQVFLDGIFTYYDDIE